MHEHLSGKISHENVIENNFYNFERFSCSSSCILKTRLKYSEDLSHNDIIFRQNLLPLLAPQRIRATKNSFETRRVPEWGETFFVGFALMNRKQQQQKSGGKTKLNVVRNSVTLCEKRKQCEASKAHDIKGSGWLKNFSSFQHFLSQRDSNSKQNWKKNTSTRQATSVQNQVFTYNISTLYILHKSLPLPPIDLSKYFTALKATPIERVRNAIYWN